MMGNDFCNKMLQLRQSSESFSIKPVLGSIKCHNRVDLIVSEFY